MKARWLASEAKKAGALPLVIEIVRIERRLQRGSWQSGDDGRLWVFID